MRPFCHRSELIEYARRHVSRLTVQRAFLTGTVESLGGFSRIPPGDRPGWILRVTTRFGREHLIAVIALPLNFSVSEIDQVPWAYWDGKLGRSPTVYEGDHPEVYHAKRRI